MKPRLPAAKVTIREHDRARAVIERAIGTPPQPYRVRVQAAFRAAHMLERFVQENQTMRGALLGRVVPTTTETPDGHDTEGQADTSAAEEGGTNRGGNQESGSDHPVA